MPSLGEKIRILRKEKRLSQESFAEVLNVTRQTVSNWETDEVIPNTDNITAMSKFFGVTVECLTATNGEEFNEVAAVLDSFTTDSCEHDTDPHEQTPTKRKSRSSIGWIIGVMLSSLFPLFDIGAVLVYFITELLPFGGPDTYSSHTMNWKFFWFMFALTCVSLISLAILIVFRVKKRKKMKM